MLVHQELERQFNRPKAKPRGVRVFNTSLVITLLFAGTAVAFATPPEHPARAFVTHALASAIPDAAVVHAQLAAASSFTPAADNVADQLYRFFCSYFTDCEQLPAPAIAAERPTAPLPPPVPSHPSSIATTTRVQLIPGEPIAPPKREDATRTVRERIVERYYPAPAGITEETLAERLGGLRTELLAKIAAIGATTITYPAPAQLPPSVAAAGNGNYGGGAPAVTRIDTLSNVTITSGSVAASAITGTITNAINSLGATIDSLTSTTLVATNATFTNATTTNATTTNLSTTNLAVTGSATSTFTGGISAKAVDTTGGSATSTLRGLRISSNGLTLSTFDCSSFGNGGKLTTDSGGNVACAADQGGSGSTVAGSNTQVQFNDAGSFGADSAFTFNKTTGRLAVTLASTTAASAYDGLFVGRTATTTIRGDGVASTLPYASSTAITVSGTGYFGTASTSNLTISNIQSSLLKTGASGSVAAAVAGTDYATPSQVASAYPFALTANATSTLTQFNAGLTAYASSTVGNATQASGLTISGGATTTGFLVVQGTAASSTFAAGLSVTALDTTSGTATSTMRGLKLTSNGLTLSTLASSLLKTDSSGNVVAALSGTDYAPGNVTFPFSVTGYGVSTSTTVGFTNGLLGTASSTFTSEVRLSSLSGGSVGIGAGGLLYSAPTTTFSGALAYNNGTVTLNWPFPSDATTTRLTFSGGLLSLASTTIGNGTAAGGLTVSGTATTTNAVITGVTSSLLKTNSLGQITAAILGTDYVNYAWPFTPATNFNANSNGTTSPLWLRAAPYSLQASSTVALHDVNVFGSLGVSSTTPWGFLSVNTTATSGPAFAVGSSTATSLIVSSSGFVGVGTTSPWAKFSVNPAQADFTGPSFVVGSSTATRFIIDNAGNVGIGTTTPNNLTSLYSATKSALEFSGAAAGSWTMGYDVSNGRFSIASSTALGTTDRLVINSSGNVGVGTTSPWAKLSIDAPAGVNSFAIGSSTATYFLVSPLGRVGIGSTSPMSALDVNGSINFSGKLYEDGVEILGSMIAPFASSCPTGWTEYTAARGRAVVGTPSGGTNAGTVGSALTNLGTRTTTDTAAHTHSVDPPNTNVSITLGGYDGTIQSGGDAIERGLGGSNATLTAGGTIQSATVDIGSFTSGSTGVASVDVTMPYIQLTYCQKTAGSDIAEWIPSDQDLSHETIVSVDPDAREKVVASAKEYDASAVGIIATQPGWLLGQETTNSVQLALAGRVPVRVSLKNGEIKPGDAITTSSIPGVGMKATRAGPIVGKAMEALNETSSLTSCTDPTTGRDEQCGTVLTFVNVSWYSPTTDAEGGDSGAAASFFEPLGFDDDLAHGDIASLYYLDAPKQGHPEEIEKVGRVARADGAKWKPIVGLISTEVGGEGELLRRVRENNKIVSEVRLISSGKAEMRVAPDSPDILPGDSIVLSHIVDGHGVKATTDGPTIARSLEAWSPDLHKETISVIVDSGWYEAGDTASTTALSEGDESLVERIFDRLAEHLRKWFANATNGITDFFARIGHFDEVRANKLCAGSTCIDEQQLAAILAGTAADAATAGGSQAGAPGGSSASGDADSTLTLYGNNPVAWQQGEAWEDNLGALFTHAGQSETIYSTSTVDTAQPGTTTTDYWAALPATDPTQWLHTTRDVVVSAPANDNNLIEDLSPTGTDGATTTSATSTGR